jgi:tricorn protease-like protein
MNGEYFIMSPPPLEVIDKDYKTSNRNIKVIDLQRNNWGTITLKAALDSCPMFDEAGYVLDYADKKHLERSMFMAHSSEKTYEKADVFGELGKHIIPDDVFNQMVAQIEKKGDGAIRKLNAVALPMAIAMRSLIVDQMKRSETYILTIWPRCTPTSPKVMI